MHIFLHGFDLYTYIPNDHVPSTCKTSDAEEIGLVASHWSRGVAQIPAIAVASFGVARSASNVRYVGAFRLWRSDAFSSVTVRVHRPGAVDRVVWHPNENHAQW